MLQWSVSGPNGRSPSGIPETVRRTVLGDERVEFHAAPHETFR